jgi:ethanolamine utilization protein EutA
MYTWSNGVQLAQPTDPFWLHEDVFEHAHITAEIRAKIAQSIIEHESVTLTTVGVDIGSSTSHLLFARLVLQRETQRLSSRFIVVRREVLWRSPIMLTPFTGTGLIDAEKLSAFIKQSYREAGLTPADIDSGAVILTGEAIKQTNARAIDELFADEAGKFVCATAGHQLEAILAAHGSGAVALSRDQGSCILHVDIGGGTTKLALIENGVITDVCAFAVGGRLMARDKTGMWTRVDESARLAATSLGFAYDHAALENEKNRDLIVRRFASILLDYITGQATDELGNSLLLTEKLDYGKKPSAVTISGGVAEYLFGREEADFGDIAKPLARAIREELPTRLTVPVIDPGTGIRATVIGASQFTVQVSGSTIFLSDRGILPLRNVPVVSIQLPLKLTAAGVEEVLKNALARSDVGAGNLAAISFEWSADPEYGALLALCCGIVNVMGPLAEAGKPLVILVDGDVGKSIGALLCDEAGWSGDVVSLDSVALHELDFVDIGELMQPSGVVPLVIKSLVFS